MSTKAKTQNFDTIVTIENTQWKTKVYLGLGGLVVLVILGFLYRVEAGVIALAVGSAYAVRVTLVAIHRHKLAGFEARRMEAETVKVEAEAKQALARMHFVEVNSGTFVLNGIVVDAFYPAVSASRLLADVPQLALPEPSTPRLRRLLDVDFVHLLAVGPSGAGKTTVLCHLIDNAPGDALIYVLDPHAQFNQWPGRAGQIIGTGRDYPAIDRALAGLIQAMDSRYNGKEPTARKILIVADEWLSIRDKCENAERFFGDVGSEARKVNMSLVVSSISSTVDDLAVSSAVRDNLAQLTLNRTLKELNQGELKWSRKDVELVQLPGPYYARHRPVALPVLPPDEFEPLGFDSGPVAESPEPVELEIFRSYQSGKSLRAIYTEVYGKPYTGGRQVQELRAILGKFGVTFENVSS